MDANVIDARPVFERIAEAEFERDWERQRADDLQRDQDDARRREIERSITMRGNGEGI